MLPTRNTITTVMIRPEMMVPDKLSSGFFMGDTPHSVDIMKLRMSLNCNTKYCNEKECQIFT